MSTTEIDGRTRGESASGLSTDAVPPADPADLPLLKVIRSYGGVALHLAWILIMFTSVAWQGDATRGAGVVTSGGLSGGKSILKLLVLLVALVIIAWRGKISGKLSVAVWLLFLYAAGSAVGATLAHLSVSSALEIAARLALCVFAGVCIVRRTRLRPLLLTTAWTSCLVAFMALGAWAAGLNHISKIGLQGYLPRLQPNELGSVSAIGLLIIADLGLSRRWLSRGWWFGLVVLGTTLALSDSRTCIVGVILGLVVLLWVHRLRGALAALAVCGVLFLGVSTFHVGDQTILHAVVSKSHSAQVTSTLNRRFSEGSAAIAAQKTTNEKVFGQGLPQRDVRVTGIRKVEPVDSSWYAAYLQAGLTGIVLLVMAIVSVGRSLRRRHLAVGMALWIFLLVNSLTDNVYNTLTLGMLLLAVMSVSSDSTGYLLRRAAPTALAT
jgi:hypothetical protein